MLQQMLRVVFVRIYRLDQHFDIAPTVGMFVFECVQFSGLFFHVEHQQHNDNLLDD